MHKNKVCLSMADTVSKKKRSEIMQKIQAQSKLENTISRELWKRGIRFRKNSKSLFGTPDISIKKYKVVIFIDSCFWHVCPLHWKRPKSNQAYWDKKFARNKERDKEVTDFYIRRQWHIKRNGEHEVKEDLKKVLDDLVGIIDHAERK